MKFLYFLIILAFSNALAAAQAVPSRPHRIASTSLASDEVLLLLKSKQYQCVKKDIPGSPVSEEGSDIAAVSSRSVLPEESNVVEMAKKIPGRFGGEPESVLALSPDLVIAASYNRPELLSKMRGLKIPVVVLKNFDSFSDIDTNIDVIGKAIACEEGARQMRAEFKRRREQLHDAAAKRSEKIPVVVYCGASQIMAGETLADEIVSLAGGINLATKDGLKKWPTVNPETLAQWGPKFVISAGDPTKKSELVKLLQNTAGWRQLDAIKNGRVIIIPNRSFNSVSPFVLDAVELLQNELGTTK